MTDKTYTPKEEAIMSWVATAFRTIAHNLAEGPAEMGSILRATQEKAALDFCTRESREAEPGDGHISEIMTVENFAYRAIIAEIERHIIDVSPAAIQAMEDRCAETLAAILEEEKS